MLRAAMAAGTMAQKKDHQQTHSLGLQESNFQLVQHLLGRILEIRDLSTALPCPCPGFLGCWCLGCGVERLSCSGWEVSSRQRKG